MLRPARLMILLLGLVFIVISPVNAQQKKMDERAIAVTEAKFAEISDFGFSEKRIALIIGNQNYEYISVLRNPKKDAEDMARTLRQNGGFDVMLGLNLDKQAFENIVYKFEERLIAAGPNSVGMVFYAGHGFEYAGVNYLLPTDLDVSSGDKETISQSSINLNRIIEALKPSHQSIDLVILDACRNDPFSPQKNKSYSFNDDLIDDSTGWAKIEKAGLYVAYGTAPGSTSGDGRPGENGIFTRFILEQIEKPGKTLDEIFNEVKREVVRETKYKDHPQTPVVFSGVTKPFVLHLCDTEENCGNGQLIIIYSLIGGMLFLFLCCFIYIRKLATQNNTSIGQAFETATEGFTEFLGSNKSSIKKKSGTNPQRDNDVELIDIGYLRHNRHNKEIASIKENQPLTIGREKSSTVNVVIADTKGHIARVQTKIGWDSHKKCFWIMDLGSKNGTYLGRDEKLKPHEIYYLNSGQTFYLASKYHPMSIIKNEG
jgi:hypothetical protein